MRRLLVAAAAACLALALGGCLAFTVRPSATAVPLGPVTIKATICGSDVEDPTTRGCDDADVLGGDANGNSNVDGDVFPGAARQLMLGYRVPAGTTAPQSFVAGDLTFTRSASYAGELERLAPAGSGLQWMGYLSNSFPYDPRVGTQDISGTAEVAFGLPRHANGQPFQGPFRYRPVVGARSGADPGAPVQCNMLFGWDEDRVQICVDAPAPAEFGSNLSVSTSDLGIAGGGELTVPPGGAGTLSFATRYAGSASPTFAVRASSGVPGGTATPSVTSLRPSDGDADTVRVAVNVPAGTAPGRYPVTLTAALDAQRVRTGSATIVVPGPPPPAPPPPPPPPPEPPLRITSPVEVNWEVRGGLTRVLRLFVRDVPRGGTVRVTCRGRGCPFARKRFNGRRVNVGKLFRRRLRVGARIEIRITAPGAIGKIVRYRTRRGRIPQTTRRCLPAGSERPRTRC